MSDKYYELKADLRYRVMVRKVSTKDKFLLLTQLWKYEDWIDGYFESGKINSIELCGLVKLMYYWAGMRLECPY